MKVCLRLIRHSAQVVAITFAGLAVSSQAAPTIHAATLPQISASLISNREFLVAGQGFTSGGYVDVFVHNGNGRLILTVSRKASTYHCYPTICRAGGFFNVDIHVAGSAQSDTVIARDVSSGLWSNTTTT